MESVLWKRSTLTVQFSSRFQCGQRVRNSAWWAEFPDAGHYEAKHVIHRHRHHHEHAPDWSVAVSTSCLRRRRSWACRHAEWAAEGRLPGSVARCDLDVLGGASSPWPTRGLTYVELGINHGSHPSLAHAINNGAIWLVWPAAAKVGNRLRVVWLCCRDSNKIEWCKIMATAVMLLCLDGVTQCNGSDPHRRNVCLPLRIYWKSRRRSRDDWWAHALFVQDWEMEMSHGAESTGENAPTCATRAAKLRGRIRGISADFFNMDY